MKNNGHPSIYQNKSGIYGYNEKHITPKTFLEKIANFDFEKYYTPTVRMVCHFSMWLVFTFLLQINLFFDSRLSLEASFAFAGRSLVCNMTVFYLFFYFILPHTLLENKIIMALLCIPICIIIWILLNHYCLKFIGKHFKVDSPYYKEGLATNAKATITAIISPKHVLTGLMPLFYSISPLFFTKIVFDIIRFYSRLFKSERKFNWLEIEKLNLERDFLKTQLNPHFLFNTLNNVYGLALRNDKQTPQTIMQLSEMMRYTLYESDAQKVPISQEILFLRNYISLEKMRYKNNKNIVFAVNDSQVNHQIIAPLLTFIFIENGFKYGLKSKNNAFLKIEVSVVNNIFNFSIINDKEESSKEKKYGGLGLINIRKRLELLYPEKHQLKIEDRGTSYYVEMQINLE